MTPPIVGTCKAPGCGVEMIPQQVWRRKTELRAVYRRHDGHRLCHICYRRALRAGTLPDPPPPVRVEPRPDIAMTPMRAIALFDAIDDSDPERAHSDADYVLLQYIGRTAPKVAAAYAAVVGQQTTGPREFRLEVESP